MRLVVKGNRLESLDAALKHRIPALHLCTLFNNTQSVLCAPERHVEKARVWFSEWREWEEHDGYPTGTLLWFQERGDDAEIWEE